MKNIIKQVIISLLLIILIVLILAIILYKYIPTNKTIPAKVEAYQTPENILSEIDVNEDVQEFSTNATDKSYEVTDSDLEQYKAKHSYNPSKADPFSESIDEPTNTTSTDVSTTNAGQSTTASTTTSSSTTTTTSSNANDSAKDKYFTKAGVSDGTK